MAVTPRSPATPSEGRSLRHAAPPGQSGVQDGPKRQAQGRSPARSPYTAPLQPVTKSDGQRARALRPEWDDRAVAAVPVHRRGGQRSPRSRGSQLDARPPVRTGPKRYDRSALAKNDAANVRQTKAAPTAVGREDDVGSDRASEAADGTRRSADGSASLPRIATPPPPPREDAMNEDLGRAGASPSDAASAVHATAVQSAGPRAAIDDEEAAPGTELGRTGEPGPPLYRSMSTGQRAWRRSVAKVRGALTFEKWMKEKAESKRKAATEAQRKQSREMEVERQWIHDHSKRTREICRAETIKDRSAHAIQQWWRKVGIKRLLWKLRAIKKMDTDEFIRKYGQHPDDVWLAFRKRLDRMAEAQERELERESLHEARLAQLAIQERAEARGSTTRPRKEAVVDPGAYVPGDGVDEDHTPERVAEDDKALSGDDNAMS